jgi:hypothetical protein
MAMFAAYFDASGDPTHPFVVVSGYVANFTQWQMFEHLWEVKHREAGVDLPFHATEFMASIMSDKYKDQQNARQDYIALAKDTHKALLFLQSLCALQVLCVNCGLSCIVDMDVYNGVSSLLDLRAVVPPYALGARTCLAGLQQWEQRFGIEGHVECIFEEGDFEQGRFTDLMIDEGAQVPIYKKKKDFAGLQAVDNYAWEQSYHLKRVARGLPVTLRDHFVTLLSSIPKIHIQPTQATLIGLCHAKGIDPLTGVRK